MINKLYIILVNHNGYLDTIECLESIFKQNAENIKVLLIDNSTSAVDLYELVEWSNGNRNDYVNTDFPSIVLPPVFKPIDYVSINESDLLKKEYSNDLVIVETKKNKGFAAANNIALRYIEKFGRSDDFIWLLNNDTIIESDTINRLKTELKKETRGNDKVLFGTPLLEYYDPKKIQAIGGRYNKLTGITSHLGEKMPVNSDIVTGSFSVDYPIGASMIISHSYLKKVGLMNEEYFLFYEEIDWAERAKIEGGKVQILDVLGIYHKHGKSTLSIKKKKKTDFIDLTSLRSRILFSKRYYKNYLWSVRLFILTVTILKRLISGNFNRIPKIIKLVFTT